MPPRGKRLVLPALLALACFAFVAAGSGAAEPFVVIVNAANPAAKMSGEELSGLFLKKTPQWPRGGEVMPVDLTEQSGVRESFSRQVHQKSTAAVKAYWQKMIFSGREVPPPEKASSAEVVAYVRANRGAIGYVAVDAPLGAGVKVVRITP
jgi:ABC-type phosphate transport system substrate-binding protein